MKPGDAKLAQLPTVLQPIVSDVYSYVQKLSFIYKSYRKGENYASAVNYARGKTDSINQSTGEKRKK